MREYSTAALDNKRTNNSIANVNSYKDIGENNVYL